MEVEHKMRQMEIELTELLIQIFKDHGWEIDNLPSIYDSDETPVENQDWDFDRFLGVYEQTNKTWCDVGKVILYPKNIEKVAKAFYEHDQLLNVNKGQNKNLKEGEVFQKSNLLVFLQEGGRTPDYGVKLEDAIDFLTAIVLIHELTHWMIHWNRDFNGIALKCNFNYDNDENKKFHEGIAQYFTDNTIRKGGIEKMIALFEFLKQRQSNPYRVFEELKTDLDGHEINVACVFTALGVCWNNNFNQLFNELKNYNYLSVLYFPENHQNSYPKIVQKEPAIDQAKIIDWWYIKPFSESNIFLYDYFDPENKSKYKTRYNSRKFGI